MSGVEPVSGAWASVGRLRRRLAASWSTGSSSRRATILVGGTIAAALAGAFLFGTWHVLFGGLVKGNWRAGWLKNQGLRNTRETSLAKWHATEHAVQSALDAIQVHGANGYSNEFPVERYLRNSKAAVIYEGTSQLHTLIQADYALGYREDRPIRCEPWPAQGWERPGPTSPA